MAPYELSKPWLNKTFHTSGSMRITNMLHENLGGFREKVPGIQHIGDHNYTVQFAKPLGRRRPSS